MFEIIMMLAMGCVGIVGMVGNEYEAAWGIVLAVAGFVFALCLLLEERSRTQEEQYWATIREAKRQAEYDALEEARLAIWWAFAEEAVERPLRMIGLDRMIWCNKHQITKVVAVMVSARMHTIAQGTYWVDSPNPLINLAHEERDQELNELVSFFKLPMHSREEKLAGRAKAVMYNESFVKDSVRGKSKNAKSRFHLASKSLRGTKSKVDIAFFTVIEDGYDTDGDDFVYIPA